MGFLRGEVWTEATQDGEGLWVELPPEHSSVFGYNDARSWGKLPSKQVEVIFFYSLYILDINPLSGV